VTELPKDMFKKRKVVDNSTPRGGRHFKSPLFQNSQGEYSFIGYVFVVMISNSSYSICFDDAKNRKQ